MKSQQSSAGTVSVNNEILDHKDGILEGWGKTPGLGVERTPQMVRTISENVEWATVYPFKQH